jgi:tyrosyl-tRNA synthetase
MPKSLFLRQAQERGYIHQCTNLEALDHLLTKETVTAYIGFDCTAKSLHIGSLVQIMMLRLLQQCGHKPLVLMGGGTTRIGDPSGRDETRQLLSLEDINQNKQSLSRVFGKFIKFGKGETDALMLDNAQWLDELKYIDFLRDIGRHFTINKMLSFDSVKMRLDREQPLTFIEFNYMLLQAYDFTELSRRYNCRLQMGGSDQWGNIVNGTDLGRRLGYSEMFGLTSPLVTTKSGAKMGKTASGAVWLNEDMLSPYDYWQYWRNTEDEDVGRFLLMFTELPLNEIKQLASLRDKEINEAKVVLANEATKLCHGEAAAKAAHESAVKTFAEGAVGADLPVYEVAREVIASGMPAFILFAEAGICDSRGAARRLIQGRGARINNKVVEDENVSVTIADFSNAELKLSSGQKKHMIVKIRA